MVGLITGLLLGHAIFMKHEVFFNTNMIQLWQHGGRNLNINFCFFGNWKSRNAKQFTWFSTDIVELWRFDFPMSTEEQTR